MPKYQISDYIGKRYGHLIVIGKSSNTKKPNAFDFKCDCGNIFSDTPSRIFDGHRKSCGKCNLNYHPQSSKFSGKKIVLGKKYNQLTALEFVQKENSSKWYVRCLCDCGNEKLVLPYPLRTGGVKSCGCLKIKNSKNFGSMQPLSKGNFKDGRTNHLLYGTWQRMIDRCENPSTNHYDCYGGRGIKVCDEWHDFWKFAEWADSVGGRPKGYTLDRIDNDGNYEPSNCRWADWITQTSNKSSNRFIEFNGKKQTIHQWALELGINEETLRNRIIRGWSVEKALTTKSYIGNNQYSSKK